MNPTLVTVPRMSVAGLEVRTTNRAEMNPATARIPGVWARFSQESLMERTPARKADGVPLGVYSKYETDHTGPYSLLAGVEVDDSAVPKGLAGVTIEEGSYLVFPARGPMPQTLIETWMAIWDYFTKNDAHQRAYTTDFELYRGADAVDIHIAVK